MDNEFLIGYTKKSLLSNVSRRRKVLMIAEKFLMNPQSLTHFDVARRPFRIVKYSFVVNQIRRTFTLTLFIHSFKFVLNFSTSLR